LQLFTKTNSPADTKDREEGRGTRCSRNWYFPAAYGEITVVQADISSRKMGPWKDYDGSNCPDSNCGLWRIHA